MPRELPLLSESKKLALEKMPKEEWDITFQSLKEKMGSSVADQVIATMILSELDGKVSLKTAKKEGGIIRLESLNGVQPDTYISVPLWLFNKRPFQPKIKGEERNAMGYTGIDNEGQAITVQDYRTPPSNFDNGQKVYLNDVNVYSQRDGGLAISIWDKATTKEIAEAFKQPPAIPLKKLNDLDGYYCCIEGFGLPGSYRKTDYGTVRLEVVDEKKYSVKIVIYKEIVSKLLKEGKINVELDKLDRCKLRIFGVYIEKMVRPTYTEVDFIRVWGLEVINEIEYPTFTRPSEPSSEENPPKEVESIKEGVKTPENAPEKIEDLSEKVIPEVQKALEKDMLDDEFIEKFGREVYDTLLQDSVIKEDGGIISLVTTEDIPKEQLKKEEEAFDEHKGIEPTEPPKDLTKDERELCEKLKKLDIELEKCGVMKGVEVKSLQKLLNWANGKTQRALDSLKAKGEIYEPDIGRFKPI